MRRKFAQIIFVYGGHTRPWGRAAGPTTLRKMPTLPERIGPYEITGKLGEGGMGIVYLARDVALERPVAIKVLAPSLAARHDMRARFLRATR